MTKKEVLEEVRKRLDINREGDRVDGYFFMAINVNELDDNTEDVECAIAQQGTRPVHVLGNVLLMLVNTKGLAAAGRILHDAMLQVMPGYKETVQGIGQVFGGPIPQPKKQEAPEMQLPPQSPPSYN